MTDEEGAVSPPWEVSPYNALARRVAGGIWNEDVLPILEWEVAEYRVVVPEDLQRALGVEIPVLRWSSKKYVSVTKKHSSDLHVVRDMSRYLSLWEYFGEETGAHIGNSRILLRDETGRWYAVSIGHDASGSLNIITVAGISTKAFLPNRLRSLRNIVRREKWPSARPPCPGVS